MSQRSNPIKLLQKPLESSPMEDETVFRYNDDSPTGKLIIQQQKIIHHIDPTEFSLYCRFRTHFGGGQSLATRQAALLFIMAAQQPNRLVKGAPLSAKQVEKTLQENWWPDGLSADAAVTIEQTDKNAFLTLCLSQDNDLWLAIIPRTPEEETPYYVWDSAGQSPIVLQALSLLKRAMALDMQNKPQKRETCDPLAFFQQPPRRPSF